MAKIWYQNAFNDAVLDAKVRAGATFLDRVKGRKSWRRQIKLEKLALENSSACILGQVDGGYIDGLDMYGLSDEEAAELGFFADSTSEGIRTREWDRLTNAWKRFLRAERKAGRR